MSLPYKDAAGLCDVPKSGPSGVRSTMAAFKKEDLMPIRITCIDK